MDRRPIRWRDPGSGTRVLLLIAAYLAVVWLSLQYGPYAPLAEAGGSVPEETFGWRAPALENHLQTLGRTGRDVYWQFQVVDFLAAGFAAIVLMAVIQWGANRFGGETSILHRLSALPILMFLAELTENASLVLLSVSWPELPETVVTLASSATRAKFLLGGATFLAAAVSTVAGWWSLWITRG